MQEQIYFRLINSKKVPLTNAGLTVIENEVRSVLSQMQANGGIDEYRVVVPRVEDIPAIQRAARNVETIRFEARLAGAVSTVVIRGVLTV